MKNPRFTGHSARTALAATVAFALISLPTRAKAADQTWGGGATGNNSGWLTAGNWVGAASPGTTTLANTAANIDIATVGSTGSSPNLGINLNVAGNTYGLGAINFNGANRNVGDSSAVPPSATLRLNGAPLDSLSNVILRNFGTGTLTLAGSPSAPTITGVMSVGLGNATNNVIDIDGTGGITINAVVKDSAVGARLTLGGSGTGALTLSGANTYTGGTVISATNLIVTNTTGSGTGTLGVTVGDNTGVATLSGNGIITGLVTTATTGANVAHIAAGVNTVNTNFGVAGTLRLNGGLTIGTGTNFDFDLANTTLGSSDSINLNSSALTLGSAFTINYNLLTAGVLETAANYTLFSNATALPIDLTGITISSIGLGSYTPTYSLSGGALLVSFTNASAPTPNYFDTNGGVAGIGINGGTSVWDTTTPNWTPAVAGTGAAKVFDSTQTAYFGASGGGTAGTVTVDAGGVSANFGIEFDVTGYTLSGGAITLGGTTPTVTVLNSSDSATIGSILSGSTGLTKAGGGSLVLSGANDFSGTVSINGGLLSVDNDGNLGAATNPLVFGGGTLKTTAAIAAARNITITAGAGGGTIDTSGFDSSTSGTTTINDSFTKAGTGDLLLNNTVTFGAGAALTVSGGSLTLGQFGGTVTMFAGATLNGNLILKNGIRLNFNGAYTGTGQIQVQTTFASLANTGSGVVVTIGNNIVLNSLGSVGPFVTNLGPVSAGNITVNGVISGDSGLNIAGGGSGGGTGMVTLNAQNTYTGPTTINLAGANTTSTVKLGIDNALPATTDLSFNTHNSASGATLDLNGHNQTVASLSYGNINALAAASKFIITNKGAADSVFTVDGATSPANAFKGTISDGATNKVTVVKGGTNTLTLNGITAFSRLDVVGGILNLDAELTSAAGSTINVTPAAGTASLNISVNQTLAALNIGDGGIVTLVTPPPPAPEESLLAGFEAASGGGEAGVAAVPEPGSGILLMGGIAALLGRRRRG